MSSTNRSGTYVLGDRPVRRLGYGAMQLAGPGVFGPPKDRGAALAVLREALAARLAAAPMQVARAWLLRRSPNMLLIPGTSSLAHLRENLAAAELRLPEDAVKALEAVAHAGAG